MNKLKYCLFIIFLFSIIFAEAQEFRAGPLVGLNMSQVDGDDYAGFNKLGLELGGFVSRKIATNWEAQLDIAYIQKGSRKVPKADKGDYADYEIKLDYIHFPIVARYRYKDFSVEGGVAIGVLLNDEEYRDGQPLKGLEGVPPFQPIEYATVFGFNYHLSDRLWVNARLLYSINRVRIPYDGQVPIYKPHWLSRLPGQYNNNMVFTVYYAINRL